MCNYQWEWEVEHGMSDPEWKEFCVSDWVEEKQREWEVVHLPTDWGPSREEWETKVLGRFPEGDTRFISPFWEAFNARETPKWDNAGDTLSERLSCKDRLHLRWHSRGFGKTNLIGNWMTATRIRTELRKALGGLWL